MVWTMMVFIKSWMKFILNFPEVRMCNPSDSKNLSMMAGILGRWRYTCLELLHNLPMADLMYLIKDFYDGAILLTCLTTLHINTWTYFISIFIIIHAFVFPACLCITCLKFPRRPEEGIASPRAGVTDFPSLSVRIASALKGWASHPQSHSDLIN